MIDDHNLIRRQPDFITADMDGGSVLLNSAAARVWDPVETPQAPAAIVEAA